MSASLAATSTASAEDILEPERQPVVVEMFLSQACESCPPAAEIAADLSARSDVLVLSWHVDYWDHVSHRKYGRWKDPLAKTEFVERQREYNQRIRGKSRNFTPQAIVNGAKSVVGSKRDKLQSLIDEARYPDLGQRIRIAMNETGYSVTYQNLPAQAETQLVTFRRNAETRVAGGGNAGRVFIEANVVEAVSPLIIANEDAAPVEFALMEEGYGCAVLVRDAESGGMIAAAACP